jgi:hypothetical protein
MHRRPAGLIRRLRGSEIAAVAIFIVVFAIPLSTRSVLVYSILNQVLVGRGRRIQRLDHAAHEPVELRHTGIHGDRAATLWRSPGATTSPTHSC